MANKEYDIIVAGAGHNGLIVAAYLAKAGINIATSELQKDDPNADSLKDNWVADLEKFKNLQS